MKKVSAFVAGAIGYRFPGVLAALVLVASSVVGQSVPELPEPPANGAATAGELKLSSLTGRVVLLDVFSSKCPHCIDHAPHVAELYKTHRQKGFTVLGLATDSPDRATDVTSFAKTAGIDYPVGFMSAEVMVYFLDRRNHGVPQMVLFGRDGKMARRLIGWNEATGAELRAAIEAELAKPAPRVGR
ncbi:MAG: TlpA family protein disulfide reductase [Acidobacteria bacterium]|nr:TlpA family protein disulfide reductase [Acidobacteriota bacterium]